MSVNNLQVAIEGEEILFGVNLHIPDGEVHALFGPNGSGKSVLMMTIMGYPEYEIRGGEIIFDGRDVSRMSIDERAKLGLGISEQRPPMIKGVKLGDVADLILSMNRQHDVHTETIASSMNMERFLDRNIHDGLSGGESKQTELFLMLLARPRMIMLDEPDSGVDPEHLRMVGQLIHSFFRQKSFADGRKEAKSHPGQKAGLLSTHSADILEFVKTEKAHLMIDGRIKCSGDPGLMMDQIRGQGYAFCASCFEREPCKKIK